jgi:hypothetical protein
MLKFRRKQEVHSRLSEIIAYLATRHTAVMEADLIERFFLSETRAGLDEMGRQYLITEFARLLSDALQRDQRVRRRRLDHRRVVWLPAGLDLPDPEPLALPGTAALPDVADIRAKILAAERPVALRDLVPDIAGSGRTERERLLSQELSRQSDIRCVFLDRQRGVGTHWAPVMWIQERLNPLGVTLRPVPPSLFRPRSPAREAEEDIDDMLCGEAREREEEQGEPEATRTLTVSVDDVFCGSLLLDAVDYGLFPDQPNPLWLEVHDGENDGRYDTLLLTRGRYRELLGLGDLLLEGGGAGIRLRLHRTPAPHIVRVEWRGRGPTTGRGGADSRDKPARLVWRALLEAPDGMSLEALTTVTGQPEHRVRAILAAYACFEPVGSTQATWRLNPSQPGLRLRPSVVNGLDNVEVVDLARSLLEETRAFAVALRQLDADLDLLEERLRQVEEARQ